MELDVTSRTMPRFSTRAWAAETIDEAILMNEKQAGYGAWIAWR